MQPLSKASAKDVDRVLKLHDKTTQTGFPQRKLSSSSLPTEEFRQRKNSTAEEAPFRSPTRVSFSVAPEKGIVCRSGKRYIVCRHGLIINFFSAGEPLFRICMHGNIDCTRLHARTRVVDRSCNPLATRFSLLTQLFLPQKLLPVVRVGILICRSQSR